MINRSKCRSINSHNPQSHQPRQSCSASVRFSRSPWPARLLNHSFLFLLQPYSKMDGGWMKVHHQGRDDDIIERASKNAKKARRSRNRRPRRSSKPDGYGHTISWSWHGHCCCCLKLQRRQETAFKIRDQSRTTPSKSKNNLERMMANYCHYYVTNTSAQPPLTKAAQRAYVGTDWLG